MIEVRKVAVWLAVLALTFSAPVGGAVAEPAPGDIDTVTTRVEDLINFLKSLKLAGDGMAEVQFQDKLKAALARLDKQLGILAMRKRDFILVLQRPMPSEADVRTAVDNWQQSVKETRTALDELSGFLKKQYKDHGHEVARQLEDALYGHKEFIMGVQTKYADFLAERSTFIIKSEEARRAVDEASKELEKLF